MKQTRGVGKGICPRAHCERIMNHDYRKAIANSDVSRIVSLNEASNFRKHWTKHSLSATSDSWVTLQAGKQGGQRVNGQIPNRGILGKIFEGKRTYSDRADLEANHTNRVTYASGRRLADLSRTRCTDIIGLEL